MSWMVRHRRDGGEERGASAVEFALVSIPLMLVLVGLMQYGWYFFVSQTASGAASTVARRLVVGDCWVGNEAQTLAQQQSVQVTSLTKSPASLSGATPGVTQVVVTVTADAEIIGLLPLPNGGVVTKVVKARLEDTTAGPACTA